MAENTKQQPTTIYENLIAEDEVPGVSVINQQKSYKTAIFGQIILDYLRNSTTYPLWVMILIIIISFITATGITGLVICVGITDCSSQDHQQDVTINEAVIVPADIICPSKFIHLSTGCYHFPVPKKVVTWHEAYYYCHTLNSTLVIIESPQEQKAIVTYLKTQHLPNELLSPYKRNASYWIGLTNHLNGGKFIWPEIEMAPIYTSWACGQPGNVKDEINDCVSLQNNMKYFWNDLNCLSKQRIICEAMFE